MATAPIHTPGDRLVARPNMVFDQAMVLDATPGQIWPWLLQLGKQRAGWYLPARTERLLPRRRCALARIDPRLAQLVIGQRIPDYGGREEWLEVALLEAPHTLVYRSERNASPFSWALLLTPVDDHRTELRLRFRGRIASRGLKRRAIVTAGGFFDRVTGQLMMRGLAERLAAADP